MVDLYRYFNCGQWTDIVCLSPTDTDIIAWRHVPYLLFYGGVLATRPPTTTTYVSSSWGGFSYCGRLNASRRSNSCSQNCRRLVSKVQWKIGLTTNLVCPFDRSGSFLVSTTKAEILLSADEAHGGVLEGNTYKNMTWKDINSVYRWRGLKDKINIPK